MTTCRPCSSSANTTISKVPTGGSAGRIVCSQALLSQLSGPTADGNGQGRVGEGKFAQISLSRKVWNEEWEIEQETLSVCLGPA